jgi:succinyl-CoA synthetase beta subunit
MNIHEYQAKELFDRFQVPSPKGKVASSPEEAAAAAREFAGAKLVIKAQVHAGGRGKGHFKNGFKGGVHLIESPEQAAEFAGKMLNETLVTVQTGEEGRLVRKVMIAEAVDITHEYYLAILMDRATCAPIIVASTAGAELGLSGDIAKQFGKLLSNLYKLFIQCDCSMLEINPLVTTPDGRVLALDAKFGFDDNALYRHPDIVAMRDKEEEDPREVAASEYDLNYIGLDGNIACLVNGAGLAMATMDIIKHYGGEPANFLDVGGGASKEQVTAAFKIILGDPNVKGILINIFGGIMDCNVIAEGVIAAAKETGLPIPLVVRLEGNNVEMGKATLAASGLDIVAADTMADGAQKIVKAVG